MWNVTKGSNSASRLLLCPWMPTDRGGREDIVPVWDFSYVIAWERTRFSRQGLCEIGKGIKGSSGTCMVCEADDFQSRKRVRWMVARSTHELSSFWVSNGPSRLHTVLQCTVLRESSPVNCCTRIECVVSFAHHCAAPLSVWNQCLQTILSLHPPCHAIRSRRELSHTRLALWISSRSSLPSLQWKLCMNLPRSRLELVERWM